MLCEVRSLGLSGISGYEVRAECDLSAGLPAFEIVGLPDAAVKEARDRVRAAIKNCGFTFPVSRITVNLAPANQRKGGTVYDLPILAGILAAGGQLRLDGPDSAYVGELSLSGSLRPVVGMLPMALAARRAGIKRLYVPAPSAAEATLAGGLEVYPVESVGQLAAHLRGEAPLEPAAAWTPGPEDFACPDFADVKGQENVKRALEIAAAGGHNLCMVGPPGSGKSMLARRLPSILPDLTRREALEATEIHSVLGLTTSEHPLLVRRPFRSPTTRCPPWAWPEAAPVPGRRDLPGPQRGALSGRAARVLQGGPGDPAPASGGRAGANQPGVGHGGVPRPLHAGVRHESLQVRLVRLFGPLPLLAPGGGEVPQPPVRAPAGPHRPVRGGAATGL